ncbi:M20 family metallopeptidase [Enterobacteriaceae bacterium 4M9]|nr:M20 family metallopeptidase [Enterobacteriaceae bacterium 4M9]
MNLDNYFAELAQLVNVDCGTHTPQGVAQVAEIVSGFWRAECWQVQRINLGTEVGPGVLVTNKPDASHYDVLLVGHLDTVFPPGTVAERPMSLSATRAMGPGVSDMKSGLLNILWALRGLDDAHKSRLSIAVAMNPDEETGSEHSHQWLSELALRAKTVLVCEAARADGSLVKARKGVAGYRLTFSGKAAHAGNEPEKGRSAINALAKAIGAISALANPELGTTLNFGVVHGGDAANVVPASAEAELDVRFWRNDEYQRISEQLQALCDNGFLEGVTTTLVRTTHKPAMAADAGTQALMQRVEQAGREEGVTITWQAVGGGSDANLTSSLGIPTLDGFGPVGAGFHGPDEYLEIDSIEPRIRLLRRVIASL